MVSHCPQYTEIWKEAKRVFHATIAHVFSKHGKAAPPSPYYAEIEEKFRQAEREIKDEEERVQVDESVEKKDLVAGTESIVTAIQLPKLSECPPDQPSCIPSKLIKMDKIDAFFSSWLDCCFICGSSGASDTFLFCVDCGEAFHTFCVGAPIHSMERSSASGWRCSNCKVCEISGDVPDDEKRMIYCEMCDRAFTLDLLEPQLISAPSGLWICGQCVDCKRCNNSAEKGGASLRFWSQDPEKCFRCGGCTCLVQEYSVSKCQVCNMFLRDDDGNFETCTKCGSLVHFGCDKSLKNFKNGLHNQRSKYRCPSCSRPSTKPFADMAVQKDRDSLLELACTLVKEEILSGSVALSKGDHLDALLAGVDWQLRKEWITEYVAIVNDAIKLYCTAQTLGDPRFVIQQVLQRMHQLPPWLGHRALRFVQLVKRQKCGHQLFSTERPDTAVVVAKLAAAFIEVASKTLGTSKEKEVQFLNRMQSLLVAPDCNGEIAYPPDRLKEVSYEVSFDDNNLVMQPRAQELATVHETTIQEPIKSNENATRDENSCFIVAVPLSGWSLDVGESMGVKLWKDPRECCLCHICGDADAGIKSQGSQKAENELLLQGRLLPMGCEGYWVHASCAIWSSEVWEEGNSGRLHGVEKARGRGAQLKCFGCGFSGATVGCSKGQCPFNYHFCCAGPCGAVFSADRNVFCQTHKSVPSSFARENIEHMRTLMVVAENTDPVESIDQDLCSRLGSLIVHSLGTIEVKHDGFHDEKYITPPGYVSSRIFWSTTRPRCRTVYIMRILKTTNGMPLFTITPCEDSAMDISGASITDAYAQLVAKVKLVNLPYFSQGDLMSKLPMIRKSRRKTYGLNGHQVSHHVDRLHLRC
jgi:F/Y-rich N-terminus/PHD-like zinc-binding domain/PHD-finger